MIFADGNHSTVNNYNNKEWLELQKIQRMTKNNKKIHKQIQINSLGGTKYELTE